MVKAKERSAILVRVALFGAMGGAINAWLCLVRIPVAVEGNLDFKWAIVPGGALHGAVLAVVALAAALMTSARPPLFRLLLAAPLGWVAGYVSWIPLHRWAAGATWHNSLLWPRQDVGSWAFVWKAFAHFGLVSVIYFLGLSFGGLRPGRVRHVAYGVCAGVLGSLWWWVEFGPWYFALIHGSIWGLLVGLGAHAALESRSSASRGPDVA